MPEKKYSSPLLIPLSKKIIMEQINDAALNVKKNLIGTFSDNETAETINGAKNYAKKLVDDYGASEDCVAKNQGSDNVGKILVVGSDGKVALSDKTSQLEKRATNLEQGIVPSPFETDNTVAYIKNVPDNALPYAEISKVGGMSYKDGNMLKFASVTEVESLGLTDLISTLPIPESVQALEGYGWGVNESAYNYVDFEKKQFVQNVGKVELDGTEQWLLHTATNVNQFYVTSFVAVKSSGGGSIRTLCSHYKDISVDNRGGNFGTCYSVSNGGLAFNINDIADVLAWKLRLAEQYANGTPVTVLCELATPIITDISDILSDDNYIEVESGGTVTMVNEFEYAVPSEITYQIKGTPIDESEIKEALIGRKTDKPTDDTINGAKAHANNAMSDLETKVKKIYASKEYVDQEIATFDFIKVVTVLPETGLENRFYLVPKEDAETQDFFDEYIWVNKGTEEAPEWSWEWLSTKQIEVDLTNYASRDFVAFQIENLIGEEETDDEEDRTIEGTRRYAESLVAFQIENLVGEEETDDKEDRTIEGTRKYAESLVDYKIHGQNYLSMETIPNDILLGTHICKVTEVEDFSPDGSSEGEFTSTKLSTAMMAEQTFKSFDSGEKYERCAESSQSWGQWKKVVTMDDVNNARDHAKTLLEVWYDVGSVYLSFNYVNPADLLGFGEWQLIENRFLVGAGDQYTEGQTGGEATHTLTAAELPKQSGTIVTHGTYSGTPIADASGVFTKEHIVSGKYLSGSQGTSTDSIDVIGYSNGGQGQAHNNMPPYIAVYMWRRIA